MNHCPESERLLGRVQRRLELASFGRAACAASLASGAVYLALFSGCRLLGVVPDWFPPSSVALVPLAGGLGGVLFRRRTAGLDAARRVDQRAETSDLFLTLKTLGANSGEYQSLVIGAAEQRAQKINAEQVVPLVWLPSVSWSVTGLTVLLLAVLFLPQLDPFGQVEAAATGQRAADELAESQEHTRLRIAAIEAKSDDDGDVSEEVKAALDHVAEKLSEMKRDQQQKNEEEIAAMQKQVGSMWRAARDRDELKELLRKDSFEQGFGRDIEELRKWQEELANGETESLTKQTEEIAEMLQKLRKSEDPVERQELEQQLRRELKELEDFAKNNVKSAQLEAALKRAVEQLNQARQNGRLSDEALQAAIESVKLAKMELREIAVSAEELKKLEEALEAMQLAKKLNQQGELEGKPGDTASIADYVELYQQMMLARGQGNGQGGKGNGDGTGGEGEGNGGRVAEDESTKTDFETRTAKSAVQAGKILLSIKTKGTGEKGDEPVSYDGLLRDIRQGMAEAIDTEEIPPGYIPGIKKYFDALDVPKQRAAP